MAIFSKEEEIWKKVGFCWCYQKDINFVTCFAEPGRDTVLDSRIPGFVKARYSQTFDWF